MSGFMRKVAVPVVVGLNTHRRTMAPVVRATGKLIAARYLEASQATPKTPTTKQAQAGAEQQWQTLNAMASHLNDELDELMKEQTEGLDAYLQGDYGSDIAKGHREELTQFGKTAVIKLTRAAANDVRIRMMHPSSAPKDKRAAAMIQYLLCKVALEAPSTAGNADD